MSQELLLLLQTIHKSHGGKKMILSLKYCFPSKLILRTHFEIHFLKHGQLVFIAQAKQKVVFQSFQKPSFLFQYCFFVFSSYIGRPSNHVFLYTFGKPNT